jgi:hypothetical protein
MTIYESVMKDSICYGADRPLLSLVAGEICIDGNMIKAILMEKI